MGIISLVILAALLIVCVVGISIEVDAWLRKRREAKRDVQDADIPDYGTPDE